MRTLTVAALFLALIFTAERTAVAQSILFDFDSAPLHASLPLDLTSGGVTAHFSAMPPGYSIQEANTLGFTPVGFSGYVIYPNSISLADLYVRFDQTIVDLSILYACQELACDDAATMRVTAFKGGSLAGTSTRTATHPGTWPVDTLRCSFPAGFDSVAIHYDSRPPTCQDYGTIFMADNMIVTPLVPVGVSERVSPLPGGFVLEDAFPSPFNSSTTIRYVIPVRSRVTLRVYSAAGLLLSTLVDRTVETGSGQAFWDARGYASGVYYYRLWAVPDVASGISYLAAGKMILVR